MYILGLSAFYHDSAAALIKDGRIVAAAQEERFTRKKHDASFPSRAIRYCLDYEGITLAEISAIAFYEKPFLKFERLLETYYAFAPQGLSSFLAAMPVWLKEKMMMKSLLRRELKSLEDGVVNLPKILFPEHHLSHAASAFYPSPFTHSAILTIDGVGEWATGSIGYGENNSLKIIKELHFPHSLGLLYSAFTYYLGFKVNSGEYKLMGLAPYGNPQADRIKEYMDKICHTMIEVKDDGSLWMNQEYFDYATGLTMVEENKWQRLFGFPRRLPESAITQEHCDLALAIQRITENIILKMAAEAKRLTNSRLLCLAGGVALNCVANGKLLKARLFDDVWIQPAAGDAGGAVGAALAVYYIYYQNNRSVVNQSDGMAGSYLGPEYSAEEIKFVMKRYKAKYEFFEKEDEIMEKIAELISLGNVVGWFQGRMEYGPRALGNRSILADARSSDMQRKLNLKIKYREGFRPFAPAVLQEDAQDYFVFNHSSPYMLFIAEVSEKRRKKIADGYYAWPLEEKLYYERSDIPAVTHIDYTARLQTVHKETNEKYWQLLRAFKKLTGCSLMVNTSFNVRGEPLVCTPEEAYLCFMRTEMDYLVMERFLLNKKEQRKWEEKVDWKNEYGLD